MNLAQMKLFIQGYNKTREIDNNLPQQIGLAINGIGSNQWSSLRWLNDASNWDLLGIRFSGGGGYYVAGVEGNVDVVFNWESWEMSVLASVGGVVGINLGASVGAGVVLGFNAPDNSVLWGGSWGINVEAAAIGGLGLEYSNSIGTDYWSFSIKGLAGGCINKLSGSQR